MGTGITSDFSASMGAYDSPSFLLPFVSCSSAPHSWVSLLTHLLLPVLLLGLPVPCVDNLPRHPGFLKDLTINSCLLDLRRSQTPPKPTTLSQHPLLWPTPCRAGIYLFGEIWCLRSEICSIWIYNLCYKSAWINFLIYLIAVFILVSEVTSKYNKTCAVLC